MKRVALILIVGLLILVPSNVSNAFENIAVTNSFSEQDVAVTEYFSTRSCQLAYNKKALKLTATFQWKLATYDGLTGIQIVGKDSIGNRLIIAELPLSSEEFVLENAQYYSEIYLECYVGSGSDKRVVASHATNLESYQTRIKEDEAKANSDKDKNTEYFKYFKVRSNNNNLSCSWSLNHRLENIYMFQIVAENRDGKKEIIADLGQRSEEYEFSKRQYLKYKNIFVECYEKAGNGKKILESREVQNPYYIGYDFSTDGAHGLQYHTQSEIKALWKKMKINNKPVKYAKKPNNKKPYKQMGMVSNSSLKNGLNALNFVRYVAGISSDIQIKNSYQDLAQAAAYVNYNDKKSWISHAPHRPKGMVNSMYKKGKKGSSQSNLAAGYSNIANSIFGYMEDSDSGNINRVGHRRWCLNPSMKYTGLGADKKVYAMYAFDQDEEDEASNKIVGVHWPAANMPVNLFDSDQAWNISFGIPLEDDNITVKLHRNNNPKTWTFDSTKKRTKNNFIVVEPSGSHGYEGGSVIFRPNNVKYKAGDSFTVTITGTDFIFEYDVKFFKLY